LSWYLRNRAAHQYNCHTQTRRAKTDDRCPVKEMNSGADNW